MAENRPTDPTLLDKMSSEVAPEVSPLLRFLLNNARRIGMVTAVFVLAAAGFGIYKWQSDKQLREAQNALGTILAAADNTDRLAKLKTFLPTAPAPIKNSVLLALAKAASDAKDYTAAADAWGEIAKDPKDPLYITATIGKAENLALADKAAEALAAVEAMTLPAGSAAQNLVNTLIVDLAEKTGNVEKAIAACEKLVTGTAMTSPEEADFWRQKAASLRLQGKAAKS
ncbi:hypothetical protein LJC26_07025 [Desulfovibrio sp. OttesenSCG-928-O18]|nr:hypothetical protein [Desulfovibrio sp. OttesenSCG-928-O18]